MNPAAKHGFNGLSLLSFFFIEPINSSIIFTVWGGGVVVCQPGEATAATSEQVLFNLGVGVLVNSCVALRE